VRVADERSVVNVLRGREAAVALRGCVAAIVQKGKCRLSLHAAQSFWVQSPVNFLNWPPSNALYTFLHMRPSSEIAVDTRVSASEPNFNRGVTFRYPPSRAQPRSCGAQCGNCGAQHRHRKAQFGNRGAQADFLNPLDHALVTARKPRNPDPQLRSLVPKV